MENEDYAPTKEIVDPDMIPDFEFYTDDQVTTLQAFLEEKYEMDDISKQLIRNILEYVAAQGDDNENIFYLLSDLLKCVVDKSVLIEGLKVL